MDSLSTIIKKIRLITIIIALITLISLYIYEKYQPQINTAFFNRFIKEELKNSNVLNYEVNGPDSCFSKLSCKSRLCKPEIPVKDCYSYEVVILLNQNEFLTSQIDYKKFQPVRYSSNDLNKDIEVLKLFNKTIKTSYNYIIKSYHTNHTVINEYGLIFDESFTDIYNSVLLDSLFTTIKQSNGKVERISISSKDGYELLYSLIPNDDADITINNNNYINSSYFKKSEGYKTVEEIESSIKAKSYNSNN